MNTTLHDIRDLECRLHSHAFDWKDSYNTPDDLMYVLDQLQEIHNWLDRYDVPRTHGDGNEADLLERVKWLALTVQTLQTLPQHV